MRQNIDDLILLIKRHRVEQGNANRIAVITLCYVEFPFSKAQIPVVWMQMNGDVM